MISRVVVWGPAVRKHTEARNIVKLNSSLPDLEPKRQEEKETRVP